jgi:HD-GYP domain-containing protein (c-di-GMP phosphodiesterase class II)
VVDVWDALRFDRRYRKAWTEEKVLEYIRSQSGIQFDPHVVDVFLDLVVKIKEIDFPSLSQRKETWQPSC